VKAAATAAAARLSQRPFSVDAAETLDLGLLPTVDEVWAWQTWMAKLGPKYTPSPTF
jgi:hypothetical protein